MAESGSSAGVSPLDEGDESQWQRESLEETPRPEETEEGTNDATSKPAGPLQKRRRVTRACDECRRKKIKCDGKQPCTHCTVYSYDCTYDQPSNRRRNPAPQYIESLEGRLQKAEALLRAVLPTVDLDDPKFEARGIDQILAMAQRNAPPKAQTSRAQPTVDDSTDEAQLETMVQNTGSLDIDDNGDWDYRGHSSGYTFLQKLRSQMGESFSGTRNLPIGRMSIKPTMLDSPRSNSESPMDSVIPNAQDLPPRDVAKGLCRNALDDCCALMRFVHQPTFYKKFDKIFDTDPEHYTNAETKFLPLLYLVMAVGCMFSTAEDNRLDKDGYEKYIGQGYQYYNAGRQMIDITDSRDLTAVQTICFMIIFLQATAKLSTCYAYIGIALRACLRLGMHRDIQLKVDCIELEQRRRCFWMVRKMDSYVSAMLGLPQMLSDEDVDQQLPAEVDDDYITSEAVLPQPANRFSLIKATNAHARLVVILKKVVKYVYPLEAPQSAIHPSQDKGYMISHSKIREIEGDLQDWMDELPMELRPSDDANQDLARVQQLLRISYAHVQMMMYRPFLHYVSGQCRSKGVDKRTFACAAACVSVARNIVHITTEMKKRGLLIGAYWFVMYTTYFSIMALVYFCLENPTTNTGREILKDAMEGRETLASLARRSLAADRCTQSLEGLFRSLPEKLQERKNSAAGTPVPQPKKRPAPKSSVDATPIRNHKSSSNVDDAESPAPGVQRASTFPDHSIPQKRSSIRDPNRFLSNSHNSPQTWNVTGANGTMTPDSILPMGEKTQGSPQTATFDAGMGNPNIPDLKNVMFPSDDPFAYPNQPISSLEEGHIPSDVRANFSNFYIPENSSQANNMPYENMNGQSAYGNYPRYMTQAQAQQQFGANNDQFSGMNSNVGMGGMPQGNSNFVPQDQGQFWAPIGGVQPGVNLGDLFGNESWNSQWENPASMASNFNL